LRAIRDAVKLDARQPRFLLEYAYRLEPDESREFFETLDECLKIDPGFWPCLILKADELRYAKRDSEARSAFERGQRIAPWVPTFYWDLGLLLARQGDLTGALAQFERGFERGEDPSFRRLAARLYTNQGKLDRAMWHATSGAMAGDAECRRMVEALKKGG
jgi:tetratricopeptide (TPR) repeat protein